MDVALSASQGAHYHAGVTYLVLVTLWCPELGLHQLSTPFKTRPCILYQMCPARGTAPDVRRFYNGFHFIVEQSDDRVAVLLFLFPTCLRRGCRSIHVDAELHFHL